MDSTTEPRPMKEIRTAYADAGRQREDDDYAHGMRCLSFLTSAWLSPKETIEAATIIGGYNAFDAEIVEECVTAAVEADPNVRFAVGREGSPVIYAETDNREGVLSAFGGAGDPDPFDNVTKHGGPDELSVVDAGSVGNGRKDNYQRDPHSMCSHDAPPVPVEEYAPTDEEKTYIRAWWD